MQQAVANRARLAPALAGVLSEVQERRAAAELRGREEEEVKAWIQVGGCCRPRSRPDPKALTNARRWFNDGVY
jgi:hypothetical protein